MTSLLRILLALPFYMHFVIAGLFGYWGYTEWAKENARLEAREALADAPAPDVIPVADFTTDRPTSEPVEVNVRGLVAFAYNTNLVRKTNGVTTSEHLMYVLVDADVAPGSDVARAAIIVTPKHKDALADWLIANSETVSAKGAVVTVNGMRTRFTNMSHLNDALRDLGVEKGPDFFVIEPFIEGRAAALASLPKDLSRFSSTLFWVAGIFVLIGIARFAFDHFERANRATSASVHDPLSPGGAITGTRPATPGINRIEPVRMEPVRVAPMQAEPMRVTAPLTPQATPDQPTPHHLDPTADFDAPGAAPATTKLGQPIGSAEGTVVEDAESARHALIAGGYAGFTGNDREISPFQIAFGGAIVGVIAIVATGNYQWLLYLPLVLVVVGWILFIRLIRKRRDTTRY